MKKHIRWEELKFNDDFEDEELEEVEGKDESEYNNRNINSIHEMINSHVVTPFGVYRADSQFNPMNDHVILIANTNFNLTAKLIQNICEVDGVESIRVISRYTMIIMVGSLFDESLVVEKINKVCDIDTNNISLENLTDEESALIIKAAEKSKYWLAYLFPNGKYCIENFDSLEKLEESVSYFKELNGFSTGRLFCSEKLENYLEEDFE